MRIDLADLGDVEANDSGGVGMDAGSDALDDAAGLGDFAFRREARWEASEDDDAAEDDSFSPQEARTLFSTLTVSSLNINDN